MQEQHPRFLPLAVRTVVCHTLTYMLMGVLAAHFLHYEQMFNEPRSGLRPFNDPLIMLGAPLQIFRGILFASVFYLFRQQLFGKAGRWLRMAWMLIGIGILGTFAAPGGSLEGFIFTTTPLVAQMRGYLEVVPQALLLSVLLCYWVNQPKKWLNWSLGIFYCVCIALPILGLLAPRH
jgi:hypothetical protein